MTTVRAETTNDEDEFTFIHFTDTHVTTELGAVDACTRCFADINALRPSFAIAGGDQVRSVQSADEKETLRQYRLYHDVESEIECPVYHVLGNHDVRGTGSDVEVPPGAGKELYEEHFGRRYYSFEHQSWHFVILDSVQVRRVGNYNYVGAIDDEQLSWLMADLAATGTLRPVVLATHIPLVSSWPFVSPYGRNGRNIEILTTERSNEILGLLEPYNIKAVLQGHLHVLERVDVGGLQYVGTGAVSGDIWEGPRFGTPEGFSECRIKGDTISIKYRRYQRDRGPS